MAAITPDIAQTEIAIVELTNSFRAQQRLADVRPNAQLTAAARAYAALLAKTNTFSHTADGREVGDRVTDTGYAWCQVGENLALQLHSRGFESRALAKKAMEGWINSPGHRANMLQTHVTDIGVAVVRAPDKDPKYISVQLFARPKALELQFQIANTTRSTLHYRFDGEKHDVPPGAATTHTACNPGDLAFEKVGSKAVSIRYQASDGVVYAVTTDPQGNPRVDIKPFERVE